MIRTEPLPVASIGHHGGSTFLGSEFSPFISHGKLHPNTGFVCRGLFFMNKKVGILTPPKTNMTMEKQAFQDAKVLQNPLKWWFSIVILVFRTVNIIQSKEVEAKILEEQQVTSK